MTGLQTIYLYDDPDSQGLDIDYLAGYLASELPRVEVGVRTDFVTHHLGRFSEEERDTLEAELRKQLEGGTVGAVARAQEPPITESTEDSDLQEMYVARSLQAAMRLLIPQEEADMAQLHIIFCSELLGEFDVQNGPPCDTLRTLQAGVAALGSPTVISTSGLIEAPKRPREYHFKRTQYLMFGADEHLDELAEQFADRTVGYGDPRLNELLKGYLLIAVIYRATGEGPCSEPTCPLYAARTQQELLEAQAGAQSRICQRHREILNALGEPLYE